MKLLEQNDRQFVYTCSLLSNTPFIRPQNGLKLQKIANKVYLSLKSNEGQKARSLLAPGSPTHNHLAF